MNYRKLLKIDEKLKPGARVMLSRTFLQNTGQYCGDAAPCHTGPFARGEIIEMDSVYFKDKTLAKVKWDNGKVMRVLPGNLWPCDVLEPA